MVNCSTHEWRDGLPSLSETGVTLRELTVDDAPALVHHLSTSSIGEYITPAPSTIADFERFVAWTQRKRPAGQHLCFGVIPPDRSEPVGIIQIWPLGPDFETAEWGFALGEAYWGTGLFVSAARLALDFAFGTLGVHRIEARAAVDNRRGNGALRKLGATCEATLRRNFKCGGAHLDHNMWSILADEWRERREKTPDEVDTPTRRGEARDQKSASGLIGTALDATPIPSGIREAFVVRGATVGSQVTAKC